MSQNSSWTETVRLPIATIQDVLVARFVGCQEATKLGFSPGRLANLAAAISEITRNVVQHAGGPGVIRIGPTSGEERLGLRIIVSDQGKGMDRPERFLEADQLGRTGEGLPGTRRLVDHLQLQSTPGRGTTVTIEVWQQEEKT